MKYASVRPDPNAYRRWNAVMTCVHIFMLVGTAGALVAALFSAQAGLVVLLTFVPASMALSVVAVILSVRSPRARLSKALDIPDSYRRATAPDGYHVFYRAGLPFDRVWVVEENFAYGWAFEAQGHPAFQELR